MTVFCSKWNVFKVSGEHFTKHWVQTHFQRSLMGDNELGRCGKGENKR